jgi:hypothetical protein
VAIVTLATTAHEQRTLVRAWRNVVSSEHAVRGFDLIPGRAAPSRNAQFVAGAWKPLPGETRHEVAGSEYYFRLESTIHVERDDIAFVRWDEAEKILTLRLSHRVASGIARATGNNRELAFAVDERTLFCVPTYTRLVSRVIELREGQQGNHIRELKVQLLGR